MGEELDFPPVRNGVDYLVSVVDHLYVDMQRLPQATDPRDIKYAVLHLQAATEVLLKARLVREHWSLVFRDPGLAAKRRYRDGDFDSCGMDETLRRLRQVVGITITKEDEKSLKSLARDRNALQHYGLTHNARAIETRAGAVLDFLVRFLDEELLPDLSIDESSEISQEMIRVRDGLRGIFAFIDQRRKRVYGELKKKGLDDHAIHCPNCGNTALVVKNGGNRCHFCDMSWPDAYTLARRTEFYLNPDEEPDDCPYCQKSTVAVEVSFLSNHEALYRLCYSCDKRVPDTTFNS
ncbi:hypothetical protein [Streptomyces rubiginosohelvolus]